MATANIHDPSSIEQIYPPDAYASDASENERRKPAVLKGVRVTSAPDEAGDFTIERATQQVGEVPGAVFLAPFHRATAQEDAAVNPESRDGYEAFVSDIIEAAVRFGYRAEESPGRGDARLRGPRQ